ncbi:unannotated protein [freshwater metagenome]|jgi:hypothetical protein|uniref:Unannotated protein n=1 Tax=freshwater metagenome TaxID=449393 RepID=A0A6J7DJZ7_9ZZZZ|nr:hypothetical protein [Actinomycetota bacterium]
MREITTKQLRIAFIAIAGGVILGALSLVRLGSILIALGTGVIAIARWNTGKVERYLAIGIAIALLALAISLPRGL